MNTSVFVIGPDKKLTELSRTSYDSEDLFQALLGDYPDLLRAASGPSGRLLLVRREAPIPEAQDSAGRWSLDHLFLDRDGVPVLVEVKRATDTRARREVVAQMLDYAANGVAFWPIEQLVEAFASTVEAEGGEADAKLSEFLEGGDPEGFWRQVESNLRSGRVRMVFVADRIPKELRRIVEFLNEQMRPAEVLAIEVEQYLASDGLRLLTPRVVGDTERAAGAKAVSATKPKIDQEEWLSTLADVQGTPAAAVARRLLDWFRSRGFETGLTNTQDSAYARLFRPDGKPTWPFFIRRSTGKVETSLQYLKENPAFASEEARLALLDRIKSLPDQKIATTRSTGWPAVPLQDLAREEVWNGFTAIAEYVQQQTGQAGA
ncbi:MAG: hypothetical protein RBS50_08825 [Phenylobacterium sp.]|jgi:hypothetical protein|uniref:hypothetical protein n=3 Tax=Phenylobacterium sp. TaxID=1871053 RepID=UPI002A36D520|nr:hypothetical protein [Phenylobacterium sp.]MDX9998050.1 hypothetical protein [Phenylobacterium sp.]